MVAAQPFWQRKSLAELSDTEWESLCDGCGKCCLHKIEDEDTGELLFTRIACRQLDLDCIRCQDYAGRFKHVPECLDVRAMPAEQYRWLPVSCAYRLLSEGRSLPDWHPLISGDQRSVIEADVSIIRWAVSENAIGDDDWFDQVLDGVVL